MERKNATQKRYNNDHHNDLHLVALFLILVVKVAVGAPHWGHYPVETFQVSEKYTMEAQIKNKPTQKKGGVITVRSFQDQDEVKDRRQGKS